MGKAAAIRFVRDLREHWGTRDVPDAKIRHYVARLTEDFDKDWTDREFKAAKNAIIDQSIHFPEWTEIKAALLATRKAAPTSPYQDFLSVAPRIPIRVPDETKLATQIVSMMARLDPGLSDAQAAAAFSAAKALSKAEAQARHLHLVEALAAQNKRPADLFKGARGLVSDVSAGGFGVVAGTGPEKNSDGAPE